MKNNFSVIIPVLGEPLKTNTLSGGGTGWLP
jgi:hypothetical protein